MTTRRLLRRKSCTGKRVYHTRAEADMAKREQIRKGGLTGFLNVYPCRFGSHFHVGRRPLYKKRGTTR